MNCKETTELLPSYIEGTLEKDIHDEVANHLSGCNGCRDEMQKLITLESLISKVKEEDTPLQVDIAFQALLEGEIKNSKLSLSDKINQKHISLSVLMRYAAGLLLLVTGGFIGYYIRPAGDTNNEVLSMKQEMSDMKNLVIYSLLKQESASERIKAVSFIREISKPDPKLVETLFTTLNNDRNVNVRLAAAQALSRFKDNREIAKGIVKSLEVQTEPMVQIMLINLAVESGNNDVAPELTKLLQRSDLMDEVKVYAKKGIKTLSI